jgi:hypothetical protein
LDKTGWVNGENELLTESLVRDQVVADLRPDKQGSDQSHLSSATASVLILAAVLLMPAVGLIGASGQGQLMEDGFMILLPQRVLHGALAYKDFDWLWGPAGLWLPALLHSLLGWTLVASRLVGLLYAAVLTYSTYALVRRWSELLGVFAGVTVTLINRASDLPQYAALGLSVLALYCAYRALIGRGRLMARWALLAGLAAGWALLFRPDRGAGAALALVAVFWGSRDRLKYAGIAFGLCVAAFALYAGLAGFGRTWDNVAISAALVPGERFLSLPFSSYQMDLWLALVAVAAVVVPMAGWRRRQLSPESPKGPILLGGTVLGLTLLPEFFQRADAGHLLVAGCVLIALLPVSLSELSSSALPAQVAWPRALRYGLAAMALFAVGGYQEALVPYVQAVGVTFGLRSPGTSTVSHLGRTYIYDTPDAPLMAQLITWIDDHSKPGERLFIGPGDLSRTVYSDNSIAVLLPQLRSEMHFPDMNPSVARRSGAELAADVNAADIVVLDRQIDQWREPNVSTTAGSPAANAAVRAHFCPTAQFGLYEVLLRCRG